MKTSLMIAALAAFALAGCATSPAGSSAETAALSRIAVTGVTQSAVARVIDKHATQADKEQAAARIVTVASALKALGDDSLASLPQVSAALAPMLDRLGLTPQERLNANLLVQALVVVVKERTDADKYVATINLLLDDVITAALAYLPAAAPAPPG